MFSLFWDAFLGFVHQASCFVLRDSLHLFLLILFIELEVCINIYCRRYSYRVIIIHITTTRFSSIAGRRILASKIMPRRIPLAPQKRTKRPPERPLFYLKHLSCFPFILGQMRRNCMLPKKQSHYFQARSNKSYELLPKGSPGTSPLTRWVEHNGEALGPPDSHTPWPGNNKTYITVAI